MIHECIHRRDNSMSQRNTAHNTLKYTRIVGVCVRFFTDMPMYAFVNGHIMVGLFI